MSFLNKARRFLTGPDKRASRERRRLKRMACHQAFVCTRGGESFPLTVIDVGFGGFKVISENFIGERGDLLHLRRVVTDFRRHMTGAYTTGLMVRVAWSKKDEVGFEAGLYLPEAPGSMRINWFRELLGELGLKENAVFTQRHSRRHRCKLPATIRQGFLPVQEGFLLDLSPGGGLFSATKAAPMGDTVQMTVQWGRGEMNVAASVVGVRATDAEGTGQRWLHSLKFHEPLSKGQERTLYTWLEELAQNE
jgi:PilZ domain